MTILAARPLALAVFILFALPACAPSSSTAPTANAAPVTGVDLGPSSRIPTMQLAMAGAGHEIHLTDTSAAPNVQPVHDDGSHAHATGTVNSVDPAQHKVNVSHQPITALGWPAMTMDFAVAPAVDLSRIKPGSRVDFSLEKGQGGMYKIDTLQPAGK